MPCVLQPAKCFLPTLALCTTIIKSPSGVPEISGINARLQQHVMAKHLVVFPLIYHPSVYPILSEIYHIISGQGWFLRSAFLHIKINVILVILTDYSVFDLD